MKTFRAVFLFSLCTTIPAFAGIGKQVIPFRSDETGAVGLMTEDGSIVAPAVFDSAGKFSHGICSVRLGDRYGYISEEGLNITAMNLFDARDFTATPAGTPYASVRFENGWNIIDERGIPVFPRNYAEEIRERNLLGLAEFYLDSRTLVRADAIASESFSKYAQSALDNYLSFWYPKKEYETTQDWRARTSDEKLQIKLEELRRIAAARFASERGKSTLFPEEFALKKYDADNSTFLLVHKNFGTVLVPVPRKKAAEFRSSWQQAKIVAPDYGIGKNDRLILKSIDFVLPSGDVYRADPDAVYEAGTQFGRLKISLPGGTERIEIPPRSVLSDVDRNIPVNPVRKERSRFACILVNESYEATGNVPFAGEDGFAFEKYCEKTLGIPRERIIRSKNNSLGHMKTALSDLAKKAEVFPDAEIIFFYVGKSVTDRYGNEYLLPTDCRPTDGVSRGLKIKELYETLGSLKAKLTTVFLDSEICFHDSQRGEKRVAAESMIELSDAVPAGNSVVFRSARPEEKPQRFPEKSHGLFTYFLLKKINETRGNVEAEALADYLETQILQTATERFNVTQRATATPSEALGDAWASLKLR